ncbi:MAG TPA: type II toxin-antitoxin system prevent-host-death family antitoxin [Candidatus Dormibacteraeota bacterium]|nr:type II toxin-antitoxin system prevent-host-death family antitoxin [Candidatus Dormibacteraeota bacterium]
MERHVGIYEMRSRLGELVRAAQSGESIVVDVRGRPAARLVPFHEERATDAATWLKDRVRAEKKPWGVTARDLVTDGRR